MNNSFKYYYNGITLLDYCKLNNLNYDTISAQILAEEKKNIYSLDVLTKVLIEVNSKDLLYKYNGIRLDEYCTLKNINYNSVCRKIKIEKFKDPDRDIKDIIIEIIDNISIEYMGVPIDILTSKIDDIKSDLNNLEDCLRKYIDINILELIRKYYNNELYRKILNKRKFPFIELIKYAINNKGSYEELFYGYLESKGSIFYKGIPLKDYCSNNHYTYKTLVKTVKELREEDKVSSLDDIVEKAIEKNKYSKNIIYYYNNIPLKTYCEENDIKYRTVLPKLQELKKNNNSIEEAIEEAIKYAKSAKRIKKEKKEKKPRGTYYYNGILLYEFCNNNKDYPYAGLVNKISKELKEKNITSIDEKNRVIEMVVNSYKPKEVVMYNGISLHMFCDKMNYNYQMIIYNFRRYQRLYPDKDDNDLLDIVINEYKMYGNFNFKYRYNNISLYKYCLNNDLCYFAIVNKINKDISDDNIDIKIERAVKEYKKYKNNKEKNDIIRNINNYNSDDVINYLNISKDDIKLLLSKGYDIEKSILICYFITNNNRLDIDKFNKLVCMDLDEANKYELIIMYKCKLFDTRDYIIKKYLPYICSITYSYKKEECIDELKYYLFIILENITLNIPGQIINYINKCLKYHYIDYLNKYKKEINTEDVGTYRIIKSAKEESFSEDMLYEISKLSKEYQKFIILRYKECCSYEELSNYFRCDIKQIKKMELDIIGILRGSISNKYKRK